MTEIHPSRVVPQCLLFEHASIGHPLVLFTFPSDYTVNVLLESVPLSATADSPLATFGVDESSAVRQGATKCVLAEPSTIYLPPPQWQTAEDHWLAWPICVSKSSLANCLVAHPLSLTLMVAWGTQSRAHFMTLHLSSVGTDLVCRRKWHIWAT